MQEASAGHTFDHLPHTMDKYDVVIIGAGPAGLQCGLALGESGLSVLLLERKSVIGPKACAGALTALSDSFPLPADKMRTFEKQYVVLNNRERIISLVRPLRTIDRHDLGQFQLNRLLAQGTVQVRTNLSAVSLSRTELLLSDGSAVRFRFLVGADGSASLVRRFLGLAPEYYSGMHYLLPGTFDRMVWFFMPRLIATGYAWIIPHTTSLSAGVYFNPRRVAVKNAWEALHRCLDRYGVKRGSVQPESAPINCRYHGLQFDNFFLTGDAAGLPSAATGEGIAYALASGEEAALRILGKEQSASARFDALLRHKAIQEKIMARIDSLPLLRTPLFHIYFSLTRFLWMQKKLTG
jgi:flavin-dependent dehydrogenase